MLELADFRSLVETRLRVNLSHATSQSLLREELSFDSLAMIEVLIMFANHGITLPEDLIAELRTFGDLHHYFNVLSPRSILDIESRPEMTDIGRPRFEAPYDTDPQPRFDAVQRGSGPSSATAVVR